MKLIIDPAWSLARTIEAAFEASTGSGNSSRGYRLSVLMAWANIVGRGRAIQELNALRDDLGGWTEFGDALGIKAFSVRKLRHHFEAVPDHTIHPANPRRTEMSTLFDFSLLGSGGYGEFWKAKDALGRTVAVKYMTAPTGEAQQSVLAHATPLAFLGSHPNIVFVYYCDYLPHPVSGISIPAMVMEYVDGETLRSRLLRQVTLPQAFLIGDALCNALIFVHSKGLVHGDLHEDNVMHSRSGQIKVIDLINERRASRLTSRVRQRGIVDDVEAVKAILENLLEVVGEQLMHATFKERVTSLRDVAGIQAVFSDLPSITDRQRPVSQLPDFLLVWSHVERALAELAGVSASERRLPVQVIISKLELDKALREEVLELSKLRNNAVHGDPYSLDSNTLQRLRSVKQALLGQLGQTPPPL